MILKVKMKCDLDNDFIGGETIITTFLQKPQATKSTESL